MLIIFEINRVTTATIITSVAEYIKVKFVRCPSSNKGNQSSADCFKSNKNICNVLNFDNRVHVYG